MNTLADTVTISDEELASLSEAIKQRHGIDFSCYEPKSLKRRLVRALHIMQIPSIHDLWVRILRDRNFIYPLLDEISVGLTAMFRDPRLWQRLKSILTTDLALRSDLAVWHAGCSTGEEVYTMGIVLREAKFNRPIVARATDISNQALLTAQTGAYNLHKIDEYEKNYAIYNPTGTLKPYYGKGTQDAFMNKTLVDHVTFEHHNLIKDTIAGNYDIIFCRNVMIYFDNETKRKLFQSFYDSLKPGGFFIIGFYDAVLPLVDPEKFEVLDMDAKIFRKKIA